MKQNPIKVLQEQVENRFPEAKISVDPPANENGPWFLDVENKGHRVFIQWRPGSGFGVSSSLEHGFGMGADEVYANQEAAYARVVSLLLSNAHTSPPKAVQLSELRRERGVSQVELAEALSVQQASISKLERRDDMHLSSIRKIVQSMGGELKLIARFPGGEEKILDIGGAEGPGREQRKKLKNN